MVQKKENDVLIYTRLAAELLKKLNTIDDETLTGEDATIEKVSMIVESFHHVDLLAEDRYKNAHGNQIQHLSEDSGTVN